MKKTLLMCAAATFFASPALAFEIRLGNARNGSPISPDFAFCAPDGNGKTKPSKNINPQVSWSDMPKNARSLALLVVDPDVPSVFDDANKEGKVLPDSMPRKDFYHWVLVDIPPTTKIIQQGQDSSNYLATGKPVGATPLGVTGQNDFASFMQGTFGGYDGPCPPWNDERLHHYHFRLYALDVPSLGLSGNFTGKQAEEAMKGHIIAWTETVVTYSNRK